MRLQFRVLIEDDEEGYFMGSVPSICVREIGFHYERWLDARCDDPKPRSFAELT
jgi:hypothetical protein